MTAPTPTSPLQLLPQQAVQQLQLHLGDIAAEATEQFFLAYPDCYRGDPEKIRQICKEDFRHHLRYLLSALATATPEIMVNYAHWLKEVLVSRKIPAQHLINAFSILENSLLLRLSEDDFKCAVNTIVDAGIQALSSNTASKSLYRLEEKGFTSHANAYAQSLVGGDRKQAEQIVQQILQQGVPLIDAEVGIIQTALYEIGRLWQLNRISVAQEHLATAISQNIMARAFANAEFAELTDNRVICACIEGNHHSLGVRMVADAYEVSGWDVSFLGADTPNNAILSQVDLDKPDVLALSISLPHQFLTLQQLIEQLDAEFAGKRPIVVAGGLALNFHRQLSSHLKIDQWYLDAKSVLEDLR